MLELTTQPTLASIADGVEAPRAPIADGVAARGRGGFSSTFLDPQATAGGRRLELLLFQSHRVAAGGRGRASSTFA